jgi:hypothetical protein
MPAIASESRTAQPPMRSRSIRLAGGNSIMVAQSPNRIVQ